MRRKRRRKRVKIVERFSRHVPARTTDSSTRRPHYHRIGSEIPPVPSIAQEILSRRVPPAPFYARNIYERSNLTLTSGRRFEETNRGLLVLRKRFNWPRRRRPSCKHASPPPRRPVITLLLSRVTRVSLKDSWKGLQEVSKKEIVRTLIRRRFLDACRLKARPCYPANY